MSKEMLAAGLTAAAAAIAASPKARKAIRDAGLDAADTAQQAASSVASSATKLGSLIAEAVAEAAQRIMSGKWTMEGSASASGGSTSSSSRPARKSSPRSTAKRSTAKRSTAKLCAEERTSVPPSVTHRLDSSRNVTDQRNHSAKEKLRYSNGISGWCIDDCDAERSRGWNVDVVGADTSSANDPQSRSAFQHRRGKLRRAAPDERIVLAYSLRELRWWSGRNLVDFERRLAAEKVESLTIDLVGDDTVLPGTHDTLGMLVARVASQGLELVQPSW